MPTQGQIAKFIHNFENQINSKKTKKYKTAKLSFYDDSKWHDEDSKNDAKPVQVFSVTLSKLVYYRTRKHERLRSDRSLWGTDYSFSEDDHKHLIEDKIRLISGVNCIVAAYVTKTSSFGVTERDRKNETATQEVSVTLVFSKEMIEILTKQNNGHTILLETILQAATCSELSYKVGTREGVRYQIPVRATREAYFGRRDWGYGCHNTLLQPPAFKYPMLAHVINFSEILGTAILAAFTFAAPFIIKLVGVGAQFAASAFGSILGISYSGTVGIRVASSALLGKCSSTSTIFPSKSRRSTFFATQTTMSTTVDQEARKAISPVWDRATSISKATL